MARAATITATLLLTIATVGAQGGKEGADWKISHDVFNSDLPPPPPSK